MSYRQIVDNLQRIRWNPRLSFFHNTFHKKYFPCVPVRSWLQTDYGMEPLPSDYHDHQEYTCTAAATVDSDYEASSAAHVGHQDANAAPARRVFYTTPIPVW